MEDTRWLRLVTIGLVLAAMAIGYFLLAQRFSNSNTQLVQEKQEVVVVTPTPVPSVTPTPSPSPSASVLGANTTSTKGSVKTLPATGFPGILLIAFSAGAIAAGFGLRKFPH